MGIRESLRGRGVSAVDRVTFLGFYRNTVFCIQQQGMSSDCCNRLFRFPVRKLSLPRDCRPRVEVMPVDPAASCSPSCDF